MPRSRPVRFGIAVIALALMSGLSFADANCQVVSSSGSYDQTMNYSGTNYYPYYACLVIAASNAVWDCHGFSVNGVYDGILIYQASNVTLKNCNASATYNNAIDVLSSNNSFLVNNTARNTYNGFYVQNSYGNTLANDTAYGNTFGFNLYQSSSNTLANDTASSNFYGFYLTTSSANNALVGGTASNNTRGVDLYVGSSNTALSNCTFFSNGYDLFADGDYSSNLVSYDMTDCAFLNPTGSRENYTVLSISDVFPGQEHYFVNWSANTSSLPAGNVSFRQKFVSIGIYAGNTPSIDHLKWSWADPELPGYDESRFELWKYGAGVWSTLNSTPDTSANTLSLTNLNPSSIYGIVQNGVSQPANCPVITSPGSYSMTGNFVGAPNNASDVLASSNACVDISSSDVVFDCAGYNITGNGIPNGVYWMGILVNSTTRNVTIKNCRLSNYTFGVYSFNSSNATLSNNSASSNIQAGFDIVNSSFTNLTNNTAYSDTSGLLLFGSSNSSVSNNAFYGNFQGIGLSNGANGNALSSNSVHDNSIYGLYMASASNNKISNNSIYSNGEGIKTGGGTNSNAFANNTIYGNSQYGIDLSVQFTGDTFTNDRLFNNGQDFIMSAVTVASYQFVNVIFDNPDALAQPYRNYSNISISDSNPPPNPLPVSKSYSIRWAKNPAALPANHISFAQKYLNITPLSSPSSIDVVTWSWGNLELNATYNESMFELWKYSGAWGNAGATLNTGAHTLSISGLNPASIYGILQYNPPNCQLITSPGYYSMANNYAGAPYDASDLIYNYSACVKINSANVVFDCKGYNITGNGKNASYRGWLGIAMGSVSNVTIRDCPGISNYTEGVYALNTSGSVFMNISARSGLNLSGWTPPYFDPIAPYSGYGFYLNSSRNNTLANDSASGNGIGFFLYNSSNNTIERVIAFNNTYHSATYSGVGIELLGSSNNSIVNSSALGNQFDGFVLQDGSDNNTLLGDTASLNPDTGFHVASSDGNALSGDAAYGSNYGFSIDWFSSGNTLTNDTATGNNAGFYIDESNSNNLANSTAYGNGDGFRSDLGYGNYFTGNIAHDNTNGYFSLGSGNILIGNTFYSNNHQIDLDPPIGEYLENNSFPYGGTLFAYGNEGSGTYVMENSDFGGRPLWISDYVGAGDYYTITPGGSGEFLPPGTNRSLYCVDIQASNQFQLPYSLDFIALGWTDSYLAANGFNKSRLQLWGFYSHNDSSNWTMLSNSPLGDSLGATNVQDTMDGESSFASYCLFEAAAPNQTYIAPPPGGNPSGTPTPSLTISFSQSDDVATVTSDGSAVPEAVVKDGGKVIGVTDEAGRITVPGCGRDASLDALKPGYSAASAHVSLMQCKPPGCVSDLGCPRSQSCRSGSCVPVLCPGGTVADHICIAPQNQTQCAPPSCCTTDSQCLDTQACISPSGAPATASVPGSCQNVTGRCGEAKGHAFVPYNFECGSEPGCPSCPSGEACNSYHKCLKNDISCPSSVVVGGNATCQLTQEDKACAPEDNCSAVITTPAGKNYTIVPDENGNIDIPSAITGKVKIALVKDGAVVREVFVDIIPKSQPGEGTKPAATPVQDYSLLWLLLLLLLIIAAVIYWRSRGKKK